MRIDPSDLSDATKAAVAQAGELLIRAAAAIGTLSEEERNALSQATEGAVEECLVWALEGAARVSPQVRESLVTHPPAGIKVSLGPTPPVVARPRDRG